MGLFRIAVVVAVGVALLPSDREKQESLYQRAAQATTWAVTFCDRNGPTCAQGAELWTQFRAKAEFGTRMAFDLMKENGSSPSAGDASGDRVGSSVTVAPARLDEHADTLTSHDRKPVWRGRNPDTRQKI